MDPVTAGLLVAANVGMSVYTNRQKYKSNQSQIDLEVEQAKLQAEEKAFEATKQYREYVSYNAALSAMGYGGSTGFRGASFEAEGNLNRDLSAARKQQRFAELSGMSASAANTMNRFSGNVRAGIDGVMMAKDLGLFDSKDKEKNAAKFALGGK